MKFQQVGFFLLLVLLLIEINCIVKQNFIGEEDRRGADLYKGQSEVKRGLYGPPETYNRHQTYPSGYGIEPAATFSSPGYSYGHHNNVPYYVPSGHGSYGFGQSGGGYGHSSPSYGHGGGHNPLALKGLLIPLAGIALLGAAAALSTNPVLLQLGVVNGRKRRRRDLLLQNAYARKK